MCSFSKKRQVWKSQGYSEEPGEFNYYLWYTLVPGTLMHHVISVFGRKSKKVLLCTLLSGH